MKTFSYLLLMAATAFSIVSLADFPVAHAQQTAPGAPVVVQQPTVSTPLQQGPVQNQYRGQAPDLGLQGTWASECVPSNSFGLPPSGPLFGAQQLSMTFNGTYINWAIEQFRDTDCHVPMTTLVVKEGSWVVIASDPEDGSTDIGVLYTQCSGIACGRPNDPREFYSTPYMTVRTYSDYRGARLKIGQRDLAFNALWNFGSLTRVTQ